MTSFGPRESEGKAAQGLPRDVFLMQCTGNTHTRYTWTGVEMFNGIREQVVFTVWSPGKRLLAFLEVPIVRLEKNTTPGWSLDSKYDGFVIVAPVETIWSVTRDCNKQ